MAKKVDMLQDCFLSISRGDVLNWKKENKYGRNPDVDAGTTPEDLWNTGGLAVHPSVAGNISIVSTSALDTSAGTGMRTIKVRGLNNSFNEISEIVTMNGVVPVLTANQYRRVDRAQAETAGALGSNAGVVVGTVVTAQFTINVGEGQSAKSHYTVPAAYTAFMTNFWANAYQTTSSNVATIGLYLRLKADLTDSPLNLKHVYHVQVSAGMVQRDFKPYFVINEKTDIVVRAFTVTGSNTDICCGYDLILVQN